MPDINKLLGIDKPKQSVPAKQNKPVNSLSALKGAIASAKTTSVPAQNSLDKIANETHSITPKEADKVAALDNSANDIEKIKTFVFDDQPNEYPPEVLENIENSVRLLQNSFNDPAIVGDAVSSLVSKIQEHDFLKDILAPEAIGLMVRGLRESYGRTIAKKGKADRKKQERAESQAQVDKMMENFTIDI